jgi:hypothetical protein
MKLITKHHQEYKEGGMLTGEVKQRLIAVLSELVVKHQRARAQVTKDEHTLVFRLIYRVGQLDSCTFSLSFLLCEHISASIRKHYNQVLI